MVNKSLVVQIPEIFINICVNSKYISTGMSISGNEVLTIKFQQVFAVVQNKYYSTQNNQESRVFDSAIFPNMQGTFRYIALNTCNCKVSTEFAVPNLLLNTKCSMVTKVKSFF